MSTLNSKADLAMAFRWRPSQNRRTDFINSAPKAQWTSGKNPRIKRVGSG